MTFVGKMASSVGVVDVGANLKVVVDKISAAYAAAPGSNRAKQPPRLVAVSKTKPKSMIIEAYEAGQRCFGENYIQELVEKANDKDIVERCPEIRWHFIGTCQSNKASKVVKLPNLAMLETVCGFALANKLQTACMSNNVNMLAIMVQVNTSGEDTKGGLCPDKVVEMVQHIIEKCQNLKFAGLMTIGSLASSTATNDQPNPDFARLVECRAQISRACNIAESDIELSMGMSADYEEAIRMGSTNIRVGSSIFGSRDYAKSSETVDKIADKVADLQAK